MVPAKQVPKTTQNKLKKRMESERLDNLNVDFLKTNDDRHVRQMSEPSHDQDQSFQEFNYFEEEDEERGIDAFSASEPYSTIVNKKKSKSQMPLYSANKKQM